MKLQGFNLKLNRLTSTSLTLLYWVHFTIYDLCCSSFIKRALMHKKRIDYLSMIVCFCIITYEEIFSQLIILVYNNFDIWYWLALLLKNFVFANISWLCHRIWKIIAPAESSSKTNIKNVNIFFVAQTVPEIYRKKRKVEKQGVCVFLLFPVYRQEAKFLSSTYNNAKLWTL